MLTDDLTNTFHVLIADDEPSLRTVLATSLRRSGFMVTTAQNGREALELVRATAKSENDDPFDLLIADIKMPVMDGMELLAAIMHDFDDLPVVMLTAHGTIDLAVQALKQGAFDFVSKPYERDELFLVVQKAVQQRKKNQEQRRKPMGVGHANGLIGQSAQIKQLLDVITRIADTPSTVLITGESGTGKELVAFALHHGSKKRAAKPIIRINCAAIPAALIESELFGYEKGAFTGAVSSKPGRFELANGGTLFLDEIGDLPLELQVKLLRVIQESTIERVGGVKSIALDVRIVAATNLNLRNAIAEGRFREDLFYRLNVVPIQLPPLRDRLEDIPLLVAHFIEKYNRRLQKHVKELSTDALNLLKQHTWPGNIRELENIIERTLLFADTCLIEADDLPAEIIAHTSARSMHLRQLRNMPADASLKEMVRVATAEIERNLIQDALKHTEGNVTHAARQLKISRKGLQLKMKELSLREPSGCEDASPPAVPSPWAL